MAAPILSAPSAASILIAPVRENWLAYSPREEILDAALPIVDPHHHLWERPNWRYLLPELLADTNTGHNIIATVFVQANAFHRQNGPNELKPVGETEFVNGVAAMSASGEYGPMRACAGIVGHTDFTMGAKVREVLEAHIIAGGGKNGRFRGIRQSAVWADDPLFRGLAGGGGLLLDAKFREGFKELGTYGLTYDNWCYHPQIPDLTSLARAFPDQKMVLNHIGAPLGLGSFKREEVFPIWKKNIEELATCPNVYVKLGGMGMKPYGYDFHEQPIPPHSEVLARAWKPYVETTITAFGANRCMFESNFPVDKGSYGYAAFWNACKRMVAGASASEKADLFAGTATRFYRLNLDA